MAAERAVVDDIARWDWPGPRGKMKAARVGSATKARRVLNYHVLLQEGKEERKTTIIKRGRG